MQLKRKLSKYTKAMHMVDAIFSLSRGDGPTTTSRMIVLGPLTWQKSWSLLTYQSIYPSVTQIISQAGFLAIEHSFPEISPAAIIANLDLIE